MAEFILKINEAEYLVLTTIVAYTGNDLRDLIKKANDKRANDPQTQFTKAQVQRYESARLTESVLTALSMKLREAD